MELRSYDLRYLISARVLDGAAGLAGTGTSTTSIRRFLQGAGVDLGPDPRRRLYGAIRSEVSKGRLRRVGTGCYEPDRIPDSTRYRILAHARHLHRQLELGRFA